MTEDQKVKHRKMLLKTYSQIIYGLQKKISDSIETEEYELAAKAKAQMNMEFQGFIRILKQTGFYESGYTELRLYDLQQRTELIVERIKQEIKKLEAEDEL